MPRPNMLDLTVEDVLKEIQSWPNANEKPKSIDQLDTRQREILVALMESGKRMMDISAWWDKQGWPGSSPNTLRRMYRQLKKK